MITRACLAVLLGCGSGMASEIGESPGGGSLSTERCECPASSSNVDCPLPSPERTAELDQALRDSWDWTRPETGELDLTFVCDGLDESLTSVLYEGSSGHGGGLSLLGMERQENGVWALTRIRYSYYRGAPRVERVPNDHWTEYVGPEPIVEVGFASDEIAGPLLRRMREALSVRVVERLGPEDWPTLNLASTSASSQTSIQFTDAAGRSSGAFFSGYHVPSNAQATRLALSLASQELRELIAWTPADAENLAARSLFQSAFAAAAQRGDTFGTWYVRERYLALAAVLGDAAQMPALLRQLANVDEHSGRRSKIIAIASIAAITGFDRLYDEEGTPRAVDVVAAEVLRAYQY